MEPKARVSVALTPEIQNEVSARAKQIQHKLESRNLAASARWTEAERQKKQRLEEMLREYRECADPREAERLGDELGAVIFGR